MQLLPDERSARWVGLGLLLALLLVLYMLAVHPVVTRHVAMARDIDVAKERLARFKGLARQRPDVEERLSQVREAQANTEFFLPQSDFSLASAWIQNRLKQSVNENTVPNENCNIAQQQSVEARDFERFEPVTVRVRMNCGIESLRAVFHDLESSTPLLFLEEIQLRQNPALYIRRDRARERGRDFENAPDINVDVSVVGYLRPQPGASGGEL